MPVGLMAVAGKAGENCVIYEEIRTALN